MRRRLTSVALVGTAAVGLLLGAGGPSAASTAGGSVGSLAETQPGNPSLSPHEEAVMDDLRALAETQDSGQIAAIVNSKQPADLLVDDNDQVIAASYDTTKQVPLTRAISIRYPGCGPDDACAKSTSGVPYGFYGTGSRSITLKSIARISAGSNVTTFWNGGTGQFVNKYQSKYFTTARNFDKITRS